MKKILAVSVLASISLMANNVYWIDKSGKKHNDNKVSISQSKKVVIGDDTVLHKKPRDTRMFITHPYKKCYSVPKDKDEDYKKISDNTIEVHRWFNFRNSIDFSFGEEITESEELVLLGQKGCGLDGVREDFEIQHKINNAWVTVAKGWINYIP